MGTDFKVNLNHEGAPATPREKFGMRELDHISTGGNFLGTKKWTSPIHFTNEINTQDSRFGERCTLFWV